MALHMMSPSNGIVERVKNFIKPSGDNGNATKSTGEDQ